jgi:hypothetical protein
MTKELTIEGNKLIAVFDGMIIGKVRGWMSGQNNELCYRKDETGEITQVVRFEHLKYHTSWDWLMPVVEKIEKICRENGGPLSNHSKEQEHLENQLDNPLHWKSWSYHNITLTTNIEDVWEQSVSFIQWYNTQKQ